MEVEFNLKPHVSQAPAPKVYFIVACFKQNTFTFYGGRPWYIPLQNGSQSVIEFAFEIL